MAANVFCEPIQDTILVDICAALAFFIATVRGRGVATTTFTVSIRVKEAFSFKACIPASTLFIATIGYARITIKATVIVRTLIHGAISICVSLAVALSVQAVHHTRIALREFTVFFKKGLLAVFSKEGLLYGDTRGIVERCAQESRKEYIKHGHGRVALRSKFQTTGTTLPE
jgi:hypothetical protein